jgi:RecB family exonuclease
MPRKPRHKPDALEQADKHSRCPWDGLKAQDKLLEKHPAPVVERQRRRCRQWLDGELSWSDLLGEP